MEETSTGEDPSFPGSVFLYIEGDSVSFELYQNNYSDMDAITLLLNGEETGFDLTEESFVRPVVTDGSLNASFKADMPWGELITNEIPVDDTFIEVNLGDNDKLMDLMKDIIFIFNEEFNEAIATMDPSVFTTVNHDAAQYFAFEAEMLMEEDIVFHGAFHGVDFDDSSFVLTYTYDDLWVYSVDTIVYSEEALFLDGEEEPEMEQLENPFTYEIVYDEQSGSWFVLDWLEHYNTFDEEDVDRHRMEDPVYHKSTWADE